MDIVEGFLFLVILFELVACLIGLVLLGCVHTLLTRTGDRLHRLGILVLVTVVGFTLLMQTDAPTLLIGALAFGVPVAVLVPPFVVSNRSGETPGFRRVLACNIQVSVVGFFFPFLLVSSGLSMVPAIYWHTPLSNGVIYACVMALNIGLATLLYRFLGWKGA
ncbi:hypothetical protein [uncultured Methanofollis sp.]|uniref:hypothetical protein n=1 Tax=uncultured Methanofollis sp. TaxID=262500 RepID=UPI00260A60B9|nr:hypothetical protein [uncultured Methanofollis sp.]